MKNVSDKRINQRLSATAPARYRIKPVTRWEYRPGERVGRFRIFGWCLIVVGFRYFIDGREVLLSDGRLCGVRNEKCFR